MSSSSHALENPPFSPPCSFIHGIFGNQKIKFGLPAQPQGVKMYKNFQKALLEHAHLSGCAALEEVSQSLLPNTARKQPLALEEAHLSIASQQGSLEDSLFCHFVNEGIVAGVFDGHGGGDIARYTSARFMETFSPTLKGLKGDVYTTFCSLVSRIHGEVTQHSEWNHMGTTAVVSFVDKFTHTVYTATLGDSEANIYRKIDEKYKSIPLSCVRNWKSPRDAARAVSVMLKAQWPLPKEVKKKPKQVYFPSPVCGVNERILRYRPWSFMKCFNDSKGLLNLLWSIGCQKILIMLIKENPPNFYGYGTCAIVFGPSFLTSSMLPSA